MSYKDEPQEICIQFDASLSAARLLVAVRILHFYHLQDDTPNGIWTHKRNGTRAEFIFEVTQHTTLKELLLAAEDFLEAKISNSESQSSLSAKLLLEENEHRLILIGDCYHPSYIQFRKESLEKICCELTNDLERKVSQVCPLGPIQKKHILSFGSSKKNLLVQGENIWELFKSIVRENSEKVALIECGREFTYAEIELGAKVVASALKEKGVRNGDSVGLRLPHGFSELASILGVVLAGGVYVPIDLNSPRYRVEQMLKQARVALVITDDKIETIAGIEGALFIDYSSLITNVLPWTGSCVGTLKSAAYIMFTSGSTGNPKAVIIPQSGIVRLAINDGYSHVEKPDRVLMLSSPSFDAATFEIWCTLINGATLVVQRKESLFSGPALKNVISSEKITLMLLTTPLFNLLGHEFPNVFQDLRLLLVGGDTLDSIAARNVIRACPNLLLINAYGPTENSCITTTFALSEPVPDRIPIGSPISNCEVLILSEQNTLAPIGVSGEICCGGPGVALGYIGEKNLNDKKFTRHPFSPFERIYRTGDLGEWAIDGSINFNGRKDDQVKIGGFRVELGEIKRAFLSFEGVSGCVINKETESDVQFLVAYLIPVGILDKERMYRHILTLLPDYMIPRYVKIVNEFPIKESGKIDQSKLPKWDRVDSFPVQREVTNEIHTELSLEGGLGHETQIVIQLFEKILNVKGVNANSNFFKLGGNSLQVIRLISHLRKVIHHEVDPELVFNNPTPNQIALQLSAKDTLEKIALKRYSTAEVGAAISKYFDVNVKIEERFGSSILHLNRLIPANEINDFVKDQFGVSSLPDEILFDGQPLEIEFSSSLVSSYFQTVREEDLRFEAALKLTSKSGVQSVPRLIAHYIKHDFRPCIFIDMELKYVEESEVVSRISRVITSSDLMCGLIDESDSGEWRFSFYTQKEFVRIPSFDITNLSPNARTRIILDYRDMLQKDIETRDIRSRLYSLSLFKSSNNSIRFIMAASHLIMDHGAVRVIESKLRNSSSVLTEPAPYLTYLRELEKKLTDESISKFKSEKEYLDFKQVTQNVYSRFPKGEKIQLSDQVVFDMEIESHNPVSIMLLCFAKMAKHSLECEKVTCRFLVSNRDLENNYYRETIADLHDFLPLLLETSLEQLDYFDAEFLSATQRRSDRFVNFLELALSDSELTNIMETNFSLNLIAEPSEDYISEVLEKPISVVDVSYPMLGLLKANNLTILFPNGLGYSAIESIVRVLDNLKVSHSVKVRNSNFSGIHYAPITEDQRAWVASGFKP